MTTWLRTMLSALALAACLCGSAQSNPPATFNPMVMATGVTPGSQTYSTAGTYSFVIPAHNTIVVTLYGPGGGGGASGNGTSATASVFNSGPTAGGGTFGYWGNAPGSNAGTGGTFSGCDSGTNGTNGTHGNYGVGATGGVGVDGYGKGGNSGWYFNGSYYGGGGGGGGAKCVKTYTAGTLTVGVSISVTLGAVGIGSSGYVTNATNGDPGFISIVWN